MPAVRIARSIVPIAVIAAGALVLAACSSGPQPAGKAGAGLAAPEVSAGLVRAMSGVHVVHPLRTGSHLQPGPAPYQAAPNQAAPYLAGSSGATVLLRGVDDNALVAYQSDYKEAPPIARSDFAEMAALGFDFLRLPVSWSEIMPEPGVIDHAYLARVAQVVAWAKDYGIGVLVDMHQDNYSTFTGKPRSESDGAPRWAVLDSGVPCTTVLSTTRCALAAFAAFWADAPVYGKPIQQWYLQAALAVARAAGAASRSSNVVGVELMNEPWPAGPNPFEQRSLYPFYSRMIAGLRAGGVVAPLWFEPSIVRDLSNDALPEAARFSADPNLVYAVHIYTGVFSPPFSSNVPEADLAASYANAAAEAKVFGTPFVVDEYGSNPTPAWNKWLSEQISLQNHYRVGSGFWLWKQRIGYWYNWATVHLDGSLRSHTLRAQMLGGPHVDTVPGRLLATSAGAESLSATIDGPAGTAVLWGGTVVEKGGPAVTTRTLSRVTIDGSPARATCHKVGFSVPGTSAGAGAGAHVTVLSGCLLTVRVPAGRHVLVASP
ncbi:MAG: glycoside hydrolase family 5 protein [Actinobacteria bacterium]|nr:glycoside hydrolase family 5 protein [Actinomycetota bacterium]MDA8184115.1 cellulase family glycosylhydrolase [Actinomycetota bacterium]